MALHVPVVPVGRVQMLVMLGAALLLTAAAFYFQLSHRSPLRLTRRAVRWLRRTIIGEPGRCCVCGKPSERIHCDECLAFLNEL